MQEANAYATGRELLEVEGVNRYEVMEKVIAERMPLFYRTAYRFLGNRADAEDAIQDAFLSAYKHLHEFRGDSQISTWLTAIVCNRARMELRRRPRHPHVSLDQPLREDVETPFSERLADSRPGPEDQCQKAEMKSRLREFAGQLSPSARRAFQMRDLEDMSIREIATALNVAEGTLKAQLSRARKKVVASVRRTFVPSVPNNSRQECGRARRRR